jgi:hypothetical protein
MNLLGSYYWDWYMEPPKLPGMTLDEVFQRALRNVKKVDYSPSGVWGIMDIDGVSYSFHGDHCRLLGENCEICDDRFRTISES